MSAPYWSLLRIHALATLALPCASCRGHNRNTVFVADDDYQFYLENLFEWKVKLKIKVYAWCLMTNHAHLIVEPGDDANRISELMKRLAGRQSALVNKLEKRTGSLWDGRYKASPIQRDEYMLPCLRYVEMNPVRASMVTGPRQYRWSSYRERMGLINRKRLDLDPTYLSLGVNEEACRERYKEYIKIGISDREIKLVREALQRNRLTGNARFIEDVEKRMGIRAVNRGRGRPVVAELSGDRP